LPQLLQFWGLLVMFVSHPSPGMPLQFWNPALQLKPHDPFVQNGVALAALHAWPQLPQLLTSVAEFTSQPSFVTTLQFLKGWMQLLIWQVPAVQAGIA